MADSKPQAVIPPATNRWKETVEQLIGSAVMAVIAFTLRNVPLIGALAVPAGFLFALMFVWTAASGVSTAWHIGMVEGGYRKDFEDFTPLTEATFKPEEIEPLGIALPEVKGEWLSLLRDHEILNTFATQLDKHRAGVDAIAQAAVDRFNKDRQTLLAQQRNVLHRAFYARGRIKRFHELPQLKLSAASLPQLARLQVPSIPNFLTPAQYARKYRVQPAHAASAVGRTLMTQGLTQANAIAAGVTLAIGAVIAKQRVSKAVRALEDARGQVASLCVEARNTVALLDRAHAEIVATSLHLKEIAREIDILTAAAQAIPRGVRSLDQLAPDQREKVRTLWYWVLCADQMSRNAVV